MSARPDPDPPTLWNGRILDSISEREHFHQSTEHHQRFGELHARRSRPEWAGLPGGRRSGARACDGSPWWAVTYDIHHEIWPRDFDCSSTITREKRGRRLS